MNPQQPSSPFSPIEDTGMGGTLADTKHKIAQTARDTASKVKTAAADTTAKAKDQAAQIATEKKETAADRIGDYSTAIHESARSLEEKDPNIAWFTHRAADKLQHVADYVRRSDWNCLRHDCEGVARRHPAVFFGGLFVAGLLVGNLVKASQRKLENDDAGDLSRGTGFRPESNWTQASASTPPNIEIPTAAPSAGI